MNVCRALLHVYRALMNVYRALLQVYGALTNVCRALLRHLLALSLFIFTEGQRNICCIVHVTCE